MPTLGHLSDSVVMAQAWKKTHSYMRTHNWYADTLALDISALGLESNAAAWAESVSLEDARPFPLELIPAAKSEKWVVDEKEGWLPESLLNPATAHNRTKKPPIRPLAHLTIRDQTWATAAMLCLADAVETAQGDCNGYDATLAGRRKVYSYGNRLVCDWDEKKKDAWFRWGNGETYRKFFSDYQAFLKRPVEVGRSIASSHTDEEHVFVISLDISKFYDCIDRTVLVTRLQRIAENYFDNVEETEFWASLKRIFNWHWREEDVRRAKALGLNLGQGLPQGLVSAGFFANAYLQQFDTAIGGKIGKPLPRHPSIVLHDYCRYVDDIRVVVSIEDGGESEALNNLLNQWVGENLSKFGGADLELNVAKTQVTSLSDLDNRGSLSERIKSLQEDVSGPADRDSLESVMGVLEGLLTLQTDEIPATTNTRDSALIKLARFDHDVRPDTLKRFAANRLETVMRNKRKVDDEERGLTDKEVSSLDNESELLAKKLILAWMQDPSLALVLRKALEIFPSDELAEPVFDAIFNRTSFGGSPEKVVTAAQADYLLADLFRSCVDFHGYFQRIEHPVTSDPAALLNLAKRFAQKAVACENLPSFVERQALLLLAVLQCPTKLSKSADSMQQMLHTILAGAPAELRRQNLALYEVAAQISGNSDSVASLLAEHMDSSSRELKRRVLDEFAKRGGDFWFSLWRCLKKDKRNSELLKQFRWAIPVSDSLPSPSVSQRLSKIVVSTENGFVHEGALLKLALALVDGIRNESLFPGLSPSQIKVSQVDSKISWGKLWLPGLELSCKSTNSGTVDPRYHVPDWVNTEVEDAAPIYWIGMILRSAAVGTDDFTSNRWKKVSIAGYKGLRTGWFKRRMGMMHAPETLVGEYATLSDWSAELIKKCLQWPGFESSHLNYSELHHIEDLESLAYCLTKRLKFTDDLYCKSSELPCTLTKVKRPITSNGIDLFRVVTVQQLLPRASDFTKSDPKLESPTIKQRNRNHLSKLCQITYRTLKAKIHADDSEGRTYADLIVFPELGVHPDDTDVLKRLADKTRSIILAGITFTDSSGQLVNIAKWIIPSYQKTGRQWVIRDQGKAFLIPEEIKLGIQPFRPSQHIIEIEGFQEGPFRLTAAICFDATDLKLASDLKDKTDLFVIVAHNQDVTTFDTMASALHYHMYQHVVLVNKGEFGGSTIQAPYREPYERLISHAHGNDQISINVADLDLAAFKRKSKKKLKAIKTKPAG